MKKNYWYILFGIVLILLSIIIYMIQIFIFHVNRDTFFYLLQDLAFMPIQVLFVMLIIDKLLQRREKATLLKKLNMTIGVFFNEVGSGLLSQLIGFTQNLDLLRLSLNVSNDWNNKTFKSKFNILNTFKYEIKPDKEQLEQMKSFLTGKQDHLNRLLENPNLLEHETFTDLLWAVFHLTDELYHRSSLENLSKNDVEHLRGDIIRSYRLLIVEWLAYMQHLKHSYPYLFSIAVRTNPFNPDAKVMFE